MLLWRPAVYTSLPQALALSFSGDVGFSGLSGNLRLDQSITDFDPQRPNSSHTPRLVAIYFSRFERLVAVR